MAEVLIALQYFRIKVFAAFLMRFLLVSTKIVSEFTHPAYI